MTQRRVNSDTRRAFQWLLAVSLLLHLIFTPLAGLVGFLQAWLDRPAPTEDGPTEQLRELPIELFEDEPFSESEPGALPEEDPVREIEQLVELPVAEPPKAELPAPKPSLKPPPKPSPKADTATPVSADAGAAAPSPTTPPAVAAPTGTPVDPSGLPPPQPSSAPNQATSGKPVASRDVAAEPPDDRVGSPIDNPVALAGKGAKIIEKQTSVGLVLYMDRVRSHPLGKRIAAILPQLPQWDEFFGSSAVNPVEDFDRMFLLGPSFSDSSGLVMAIEYNISQDEVRGAVNRLVKQRGSWVVGSKVPTAFTYADRAERVVLFPAPKVVVIVPPHLREQAQKQGVVGVPKAKGPEAMVAFTVNPAKALRRFGLDLPASLQSAKIRITPLPSAQVLLELEAQDETEDQARRNAALLTQQINAMVDLASGVGNLLGKFGFGGVAVFDMPRVTLKAEGKVVRGRQVLTSAQVGFILGEAEKQLSRMKARRATPKEPPRTNQPAPRTTPQKPAGTPP